MASVYSRGEVLWIKFKNAAGKAECRSSGYRRGQESLARDLAAEVERQAGAERQRGPVAAPIPERAGCAPAAAAKPAALVAPSAPLARNVERIGPAAPEGTLTVAAYCEEWLKRRHHIATVKDEAARLRLHVLPVIGHMAIADVRPRHVRDLMTAVGSKTSDAPKCKGEALAPRTVRHVFATLHRMFKGAMFDEHIAANPVVVEAGTLPANVDKDPEWRATAIFEREELIAILSDDRIANCRRLFYAFEGIAGVRHGEAAALRWRDYNPRCAPLGKLVVSRSGERKRTKTKVTREIPVHPALASILDEWKARGWAEKYGRDPAEDDLILPTDRNTIRRPSNTLRDFHRDLECIGLRVRRGHDLRRTFITLARVDGGRAEVLRPLTHPGESDIIGLYTTFPWPVVCAELAKLRIDLPATAAPALGGNDQIVDRTSSSPPPSYSGGYSAECSRENASDINTLSALVAQEQRFTKPLLYH